MTEKDTGIVAKRAFRRILLRFFIVLMTSTFAGYVSYYFTSSVVLALLVAASTFTLIRFARGGKLRRTLATWDRELSIFKVNNEKLAPKVSLSGLGKFGDVSLLMNIQVTPGSLELWNPIAGRARHVDIPWNEIASVRRCIRCYSSGDQESAEIYFTELTTSRLVVPWMDRYDLFVPTEVGFAK